MQQHNFLQGSAEWLAHRGTCFNASDAAAMLGCSPNKTRSQLLHQLHTGLAKEFGSYVQERVIDPGHRFEALARPLAEQIIGDDLAPVVASVGAGLSRPLGASFDGITMLGDTLFEHKSLNDELRALPWDEGNGYYLPMQYRVQMEQQLLVSGGERVLFMASKWDGDTLVEERHCWYASDPKLRAAVLAGWKQFEQDLAGYVPTESAPAAPVGHAPETLPALRIEVTGLVTASNLDAFKEHALSVFRGINRTLTTDAHFADAEKTVKWCGDVEDRLKAAKQHALSQTESIDTLFRTIDEIAAEAKTVRLDLDKLVKARKEALKGEIVAGGVTALREHSAALNKRLGANYMPTIPADFGGAVKGLRTMDSVRNAVDSELARAKIAANEVADRIQINMRAMGAAGDTASFPDASTLVLKAPDDLAAIIAQRTAETQRKVEAAAQRQREAEETQARQAAEAAKPAPAPAPAPIAPPAIVSQAPAANSPTVVPIQRAAPAAPDAPPIRLGQISDRLGFTVTADFLKSLGFEPVATEKAAKLYRAADFDLVCEALVAHVRTVQAKQLQAA